MLHLLTKLRTDDGRFDIVVKRVRYSEVKYELQLIDLKRARTADVIEVYDGLENAVQSAHHFSECYSLAVNNGFALDGEWFVNPRGYYLHLGEVFAVEESGRQIEVLDFENLVLRTLGSDPIQ